MSSNISLFSDQKHLAGEMESEPDEESQDAQVINVIPVHFDETYEELGESSPQTAAPGSAKGKYYKQTYRKAWEQMPDFKGWLRGVQGEPTRAYCMYCEKTLHAHRLSLLKHTCTIRHQKAAQIHNIRKSKSDNSDTQEENKSILVNMNEEQIVGEHPETIIEFTEPSQIDDVEHEVEEIEDEEDEEPSFSIHFQKSRNQNSNAMSSTKPPISTHVLDTTKGIPVNGLQVSLYKLIEGRWTYINEGITSTDGRFASFLDRENFSTGRYKLHYDVDRFFESRKQDSLYPFIEIVIDCRSSSDHYHVPLLLSPYGYTTYRGS